MKSITQLKSWLDKPGNTKVRLAAELGYDCSTVISQWIKRKKIPKNVEPEVLKIMNRKGSNGNAR